MAPRSRPHSIDKGFAAHHDVVEYWDSPLLKVFQGKVGMKFDDPSIESVRPTMTHGRKAAEEGQALDRLGRSDRI
jgi:hypothetical protein